jgi:hypothetical protein
MKEFKIHSPSFTWIQISWFHLLCQQSGDISQKGGGAVYMLWFSSAFNWKYQQDFPIATAVTLNIDW